MYISPNQVSKPGISSNTTSSEVQLALAAAFRFHDSKNRFPSLLSEEDAQELVEDLSCDLGVVGLFVPFSCSVRNVPSFFF